MPNIASIQQDILDWMDAEFTQPIVEQSIADIDTVRRNSAGQIDPYIGIQFGDLQQGRAYSMVGPRADDYILPIYFQCIAPTPAIARGIHNKVLDKMLGKGFEWAGQVRKRPGGGMFSMTNSNNSVEAYTFPASFGLLVQFE